MHTRLMSSEPQPLPLRAHLLDIHLTMFLTLYTVGYVNINMPCVCVFFPYDVMRAFVQSWISVVSTN